jgi:hypothetical protein
MASLLAKHGSLPGNSNGWENRHENAVIGSDLGRNANKHEDSIVKMLRGWEKYAQAHRLRFESPIGEDYVLGVAWQEIGEALRTLLNGELGRLDGGTVDGFILDTMAENGINTENL